MEVCVFYTNFVRLCNKNGISPSAAAEEMGFQRSVITRWSQGTTPRRATLEKVATYFNVTVEELVADDKKENPASIADGVDELDVEALDIMHQLPPEKREAALAMLRGLLNN